MAASHRWAEFEAETSSTPKVIEQARLKTIPLPDAPLTDRAQNEYWMWCGRLKDLGILDELACAEVLNYAISMDGLHRAIAKGQSTRYPQDRIDRFIKKMRGIYEQHQPASATSAAQDAYAHFGFAKRARQRRHG